MTTDEKVLSLLIEAEREGYAPTTTELAAWVDRTRTTVWHAVGRLERQRLVNIKGRGRTPFPLLIRVVKPVSIQCGDLSTAVQPIPEGARDE